METTVALRKMAERGNADAQFLLGYRLVFGRNRPRPTDWPAVAAYWHSAAEAGHSWAQFRLAISYREGDGVEQNDGMMLYWLEKAIKRRYPDAQRDLGVCYHVGRGVTVDDVKAVFWYKKAAGGGDRKAMYNLGLCYGAGDGVAASLRWARFWFGKAAALGHRTARARLKRMENMGD